LAEQCGNWWTRCKSGGKTEYARQQERNTAGDPFEFQKRLGIAAGLPQSGQVDAISPGTQWQTLSRPQGNAMISVRVTAAGAVSVAILVSLTMPARACDDRFIKKCEKQSEAAAVAEDTAAAPAAKRGAGKRVKLIAARQSKHSRFVKRSRAPRFAVSPTHPSVVPGGERVSALLPQSLIARRFRGFIDPQPISQNAFETLRKPQLIALDFEATAIAPTVETPDPGEAVVANPAPVAPLGVTTTPKQDKLAAKPAVTPSANPVAQMELAAAESRPVVLADAVAVRPAVAIAAVTEPAVLAAPVIMTEAPPPAPGDGQRRPFSFHGLVLALCGALGAASALRFIVGA
jgi:hypothetical protein